MDRHFCACSEYSQDLQASCRSIALSECDIITIIKAVTTSSLTLTFSFPSSYGLSFAKAKEDSGSYVIFYTHIYTCNIYDGFYRWNLLLKTKAQKRKWSDFLIGFIRVACQSTAIFCCTGIWFFLADMTRGVPLITSIPSQSRLPIIFVKSFSMYSISYNHYPTPLKYSTIHYKQNLLPLRVTVNFRKIFGKIILKN